MRRGTGPVRTARCRAGGRRVRHGAHRHRRLVPRELSDIDAAWVADDASFRAVLDELATRDAYAIDTEFHRERTYWPQLALVQLAWRRDDGSAPIALVDPLAVDMQAMADLLRSDVLAVAHAASQDLEVLDRACGAIPQRLFDTQIAAGFVGFSSPSLTSLTQRLLKVPLAKGDRLTDWTRRPLNESQRRYAASDVAHLLDLHDILVERLESRGRRAWAEEECEELLRRARGPQDPDTAWWRIKDSRSLKGQSRGVAQAVAAWRERRAAEVDRPVRQVLPDLGILGIAHRPPKDLEAMRTIRGLEGRVPRGAVGESLLAAVRAGLELPPEQLRLPVQDEFERDLRPAVALVSAWVSQLAHDLEVETALLATRSDLQALLRGDPDARLASSWRHELVGEPVRRLVAGEASLAFREGSGDLVLEERSHRPIVQT